MRKNIWIINLLAAVVLTAGLGKITYNGHTETWYSLDISNVVQRAQAAGIPCEYSVRSDGVKMFGPWVIVAAHPSKIRYTRVDTSLGEGIILDTHEMPNEELIDIAVEW